MLTDADQACRYQQRLVDGNSCFECQERNAQDHYALGHELLTLLQLTVAHSNFAWCWTLQYLPLLPCLVAACVFVLVSHLRDHCLYSPGFPANAWLNLSLLGC